MAIETISEKGVNERKCDSRGMKKQTEGGSRSLCWRRR
ncbi:hypothetical protein COLO4_38514 [Corchorus olitorius]|uniref:Uncharacterized protein n=1 Tax=Corchorus olitorius TaxID=93759 RepID=A0A1R3FUG8_9ROSI|nr:hypothetical protein COLO4_38514 [Corchorus olitorius]